MPVKEESVKEDSVKGEIMKQESAQASDPPYKDDSSSESNLEVGGPFYYEFETK